MGPRIHVLAVDFDNDFMGEDNGEPYRETDAFAKLAVPGATSDGRRLAHFIDSRRENIYKIVKILDSHNMNHSHHPLIWRDDDDKMPPHFTEISFQEFLDRRWDIRRPELRPFAHDYLRRLEQAGRKLRIWPVHGATGGWGQNVYWELKDAMNRWEAQTCRSVRHKYKGMNQWRDQNGAFEALVVDPNDPTTWFDHKLLHYVMEGADIVVVTGQTTPICVADTLRQMASHLDREDRQKIHILTDCMSSIPAVPGGLDYPAISRELFDEMQSLDMTLTTSTELLS